MNSWIVEMNGKRRRPIRNMEYLNIDFQDMLKRTPSQGGGGGSLKGKMLSIGGVLERGNDLA